MRTSSEGSAGGKIPSETAVSLGGEISAASHLRRA